MRTIVLFFAVFQDYDVLPSIVSMAYTPSREMTEEGIWREMLVNADMLRDEMRNTGERKRWDDQDEFWWAGVSHV